GDFTPIRSNAPNSGSFYGSTGPTWRATCDGRPPTLLPIRGEDVELVASLGVAVGTENQLLAVRRELRERREAAEIGDLLQVSAIQISHEQLELPAVTFILVRGEQDLLTVGCERRRKAGAAEIRDLARIFSVGVRDHQLHLHRGG